MNTLWRKTWRDLWLNRARTVLVVAAIAVGTAATGVATTSLIVLRRDLRDGYAATNPAHAILDLTTMDEALAAEVATLPEVAAAEARRRTEARLLLPDGETRPLTLYTWPDFAAAEVGVLWGAEGQECRGAGVKERSPAPPPPCSPAPPEGTLWLERSAVPALGLAVGDVLTVRLSDGDTFALPVAGFVNDLAVAPTTVQPGVYGYISDATAAQLGIAEGYNQLALTVGGTSSSASATSSTSSSASATSSTSSSASATSSTSSSTAGVELEAPPTRAGVERSVTTVTEWLADEGVTVLRANVPEPGVHLMQGSVNTGLLMIGILGGLTLLLSAFLVINVMSAVVAQQVRVIGVLKAIGGGRRLVLVHYGRMVLIMGGLALLLAVPLGLGGAWFMSSFLAGELNFDIPSFGLTWQTLAVQAAGALLLPLLAALGPLRAASRLTVRDAFDERKEEKKKPQISQISQIKKKRLRDWEIEKLEDEETLPISQSPNLFLQSVKSVDSLSLLALRNVTRRRLRLGLTVAALALAGAMFIATFGLRRGLDEAIEILVGEFGYDVQLDFAGAHPTQRLLREATDLPGVARVEAWGVADLRPVYPDGRVGSSLTLFGVPPTTEMAGFARRDGQWLYGSTDDRRQTTDGRRQTTEEELSSVDCAPSSVVCGLSSPLYINYEAEKLLGRPAVGAALTLRLDGGPERAARLVGVGLRPFDAAAYMPYADFEQATGQRGRAGRVVVYLDDGRQTTDDGSSSDCGPTSVVCGPSGIADELVRRYEAAGMPVLRAETADSVRDGYRAQFNNLVVLLMALAGLTALVGGLGLANTMALNVLERSRELGVLRAMGAGRVLLRRLVLAEGLAVALISGLLAALLAVPLTLALDRVMGTALLGSPLSFAFVPGAAAAWLGLALLIGVVACWLPAARAGRMAVREALAYE